MVFASLSLFEVELPSFFWVFVNHCTLQGKSILLQIFKHVLIFLLKDCYSGRTEVV